MFELIILGLFVMNPKIRVRKGRTFGKEPVSHWARMTDEEHQEYYAFVRESLWGYKS